MKKIICSMAFMAFIAGVMPAGAQKKVSINVSTELMGDENKTISVAKDSKGYMTLFDGKTFTLEKGDDTAHLGDIKTVLPKGV